MLHPRSVWRTPKPPAVPTVNSLQAVTSLFWSSFSSGPETAQSLSSNTFNTVSVTYFLDYELRVVLAFRNMNHTHPDVSVGNAGQAAAVPECSVHLLLDAGGLSSIPLAQMFYCSGVLLPYRDQWSQLVCTAIFQWVTWPAKQRVKVQLIVQKMQRFSLSDSNSHSCILALIANMIFKLSKLAELMFEKLQFQLLWKISHQSCKSFIKSKGLMDFSLHIGLYCSTDLLLLWHYILYRSSY